MQEFSSKLDELYQNRFDSDEQKRKELLWKILIKNFFQKYIPKYSTVLDIGAGFCEFINNIECKEKIALDINPATRYYANEDVRVVLDDITDMKSLVDESVDIAFASNFFEHLPDKLTFLKSLKEINRVLRPSGRILILQPNIAILNGVYWDFLDHYLPLTHNSVVEGLYITSYKPVEVKPKFLPFTTKSKFPQHPLFIRLYLAIPLAHWILGKQAWIVGEKL